MRISPDNITSLSDNEVFVFGSNLAGRHGKGAAKTALKWGAKFGQGFGLQGKTFAIPTKHKNVYNSLTLEEIKPYVDRFITFAKANKDLKFLVTEIGCGLAGYSPKEIAPLFNEAIDIENIYLPIRFWKKITNHN